LSPTHVDFGCIQVSIWEKTMTTRKIYPVLLALLFTCLAQYANAQCSARIDRPFHAAFLAVGPFVDVGANGKGTVMAIGAGGVQIIQNGQLLPSPIPPVSGGEATTRGRIAVAPDGSPWIVTDRHFIMHLPVPQQGLPWGQWQVFGGQAANDITVDAHGTAWIIGTVSVGGGFDIHFFNGSTWPAVPGGALRIAAAPTQQTDSGIWVVNNSHQIIHRNNDGSWTGYPGQANDIGVNSATGLPWVVGTFAEGSGFVVYAFGQSAIAANGWLSDPADVTGALRGIAGGGQDPRLSCQNIAYFTDPSGGLWSVAPTQP
jgi:hypothetical protein